MRRIFSIILSCWTAALAAGPAHAVMNGLGQDIFPVQGVFQANLNMGNYAIWSSSAITAARYQINGSTVLALLPGAGSIGIGVAAGEANSGARNAFLGYGAGQNNSAATDNIFIGDFAGNTNTLGPKNTFIGSSAGTMNLTGGYNVFLGNYSGQLNVIGSANTLIGYGAAGNTSGTPSYSSNTAVGYQAGYKLLSGGDNNVFVGWKAGYNTTTGANNIVIGYDQNTSAMGAANELNIGGVLYGDLSAKTIGISTRVPQAALDVVSTGTASDVYSQIWRNGSGTIVSSMTSQGALFLDGGKLSVRSAAAAVIHQDSTANGSAVQHLFTGLTDGAAAQKWGAGMNITDGTAGFEIYDYTDGASRLYIDTAGEIGIGNTNPSYKLDVTGTFRVVNNASMLESANTWGTEMHVYNTSAGGRNWAMVSGGSANSDPGNFYVSNQGTAVMTFSSTNKVGINKSAAESSLQIGTPVDATVDYTQLDTLNADTAGPPAAADCNAAAEVGRMIVSTRYSAAAEYRLWVCTQDGAASFTWKYATLN